MEAPPVEAAREIDAATGPAHEEALAIHLMGGVMAIYYGALLLWTAPRLVSALAGKGAAPGARMDGVLVTVLGLNVLVMALGAFFGLRFWARRRSGVVGLLVCGLGLCGLMGAGLARAEGALAMNLAVSLAVTFVMHAVCMYLGIERWRSFR